MRLARFECGSDLRLRLRRALRGSRASRGRRRSRDSARGARDAPAAQLRSLVDFDWRRAFEICGAGTRGPCIHEEWGLCAGRHGGRRTGDGEMHGCGDLRDQPRRPGGALLSRLDAYFALPLVPRALSRLLESGARYSPEGRSVFSNPVAPAALAAGQAGLGSVPLALGHGQRPALPHRGGSGKHRRARATRHARARDGRVTGGLDLCFRDHAGLDRGVALLCGAWCRRGRTTIRRPRLALRCRRRHPIGRMRSRWSQIRVRSPSSGIDWSGKEPHCVIRAPRDPGRIAPVRTELLPAVPTRCPTVRNGRHIDRPRRPSLRHPGHEERCRRRLRVLCPQNRPRRRPPRRCAAAPT